MANETNYRVTVHCSDDLSRPARLPMDLPENGSVFTAATAWRIARDFAGAMYVVMVEPV